MYAPRQPRRTNHRNHPIAPPRRLAANRAASASPAWTFTSTPARLQAKLAIGSPADPLERQADETAARILHMPGPSTATVQRKCDSCKNEDDDKVQRKQASPASSSPIAPPLVEQAVNAPGTPLDPRTRSFFEPRFGHDFSRVRVHTDSRAADSASAIRALAYTVHDDVVFSRGAFNPSSESGKRLLAHELTHVIQQTGPAVHRKEAGATEKVAGTLWAQGPDGKSLPPSLDDISQGGVGDCYLFAAMAAVVNTGPQKIMNMIHSNADGSYTVTFKGIGFFSDAKQTVAASFLPGKHGDVTGRKAIWPLIVEKAYMQEKGGLEKIEGGNPGRAVDAIIDDGASRFDPGDESEDYLMGKIRRAKDKKWPMTALTPKDTEVSKEKRAAALSISGIYFDHAYTILDVETRGKEGYIKLFNPWGNHHPNGDGWIRAADVRKYFTEVDIND